ncbi:MAG: GlxA family transcriptional regulator [Chryseobacterium jejuense]|uniref:GlxA family transcriptional regulator n=1 Tax=Chryseobacterium jejuense TaxID=445960 RepID=UPI003D103935
MKHISIIVYENVMCTAVSNTIALLTSANDMALKNHVPALFQIEFIGTEKKEVTTNLPIQFQCSKTISDKFKTDVVIIPPNNISSSQQAEALLAKNNELIKWIKEKYNQKAEIISLCTGAYFLAECGLLNGMPATSHWGAMEDLQKKYPFIDFKPDHVVTHSKAIITGGGGFSSLNALLYFIEKNFTKEMAIELSKYYALDYGRTSQNIFSIFSGQRLHDDHEIHQAQNYIEKGFTTDISVEQIAGQVNMSKRNFIRRFKNATTLNPIEYIQRVKVEAAKKALETGESNIADITYSIGYNDLKTFRTLFKRVTGLTPIDYKNKYKGNLID